MRHILRKAKLIILKIVPNVFLTYFYSKKLGKHQNLSDGEMEFFKLIKMNVNLVIDVGARTDTFYVEAIKPYNPSSKVIMFEPNPVFADELRKKPKTQANTFRFTTVL